MVFSTIFVIMPLAYIFFGRPFDKKFTLKYYTIEKGIWLYSPGFRLWGYIFGIVLQPYRYRKIKNKLFSEIVKRRFTYQDRVYDGVINFRENATKGQIVLANLMVIGTVLLFVMLVLVILHDFVIYPDVGRAALKNN